MSAELRVVAPSEEDDRVEAQRQAFSRLMARFTADRDAMMGAVQQCNERVDALTAQIALGVPAAPGEAAGVSGVPEIRTLLERALAPYQTGVAEARAAGERALRSCDDYDLRLRALGERALEAESGLEGLRQALEGVSARMARLEEAFLSQAPEEPAALEDEFAGEVAARLNEVADRLRGVDEAIETLRQRGERVPSDELAGEGRMLNLGMRDLREQVRRLESMAGWTPKLQRLWVSLVASAMVAAFAVVYVG